MRTIAPRYAFMPALGFCLVVVLTLLGRASASAQSVTLDDQTSGRSYLIAFPDTTANRNDSTLAPATESVVSLLLFSPVENSVRVRGSNFDRTIMVPAAKFVQVNLSDSVTNTQGMFVTVSGEASGNTFRVEADEPIVLYCHMMTRFGAEAWAPVPVERWGMEYYAAAIPGELAVDFYRKEVHTYTREDKTAPAEILVIAAYDSTKVTIAPNGRLDEYPRTSVTLNAGQAYQVQSYVDLKADSTGLPQVDLGGSRITANKPIGVISGNTRASAVSDRQLITNNSLKNMMIEWLAPADQFGREFISLPTFDTRRLTGDRNEKVAEKRGSEYVRIYGASDNTATHYHDTAGVRDATIGRGGMAEYRVYLPKPHYVLAEKPAQVMMHSTAVVKTNGPIAGSPASQSYDTWGPYMTEVVPFEQWTTFAPFYAPISAYDTRHYIDVVADTNALDRIFDETGAPFDFNQGRIAGTRFMWGTMQIQTGATHYLESTDGTRFHAVQYGLRQGAESYRPEVPRKTFAEYTELPGRSYGLALAPGRRILRSADVLQIDKTGDACGSTVKIRATNPNPVGLLSAEFAADAVNARVVVRTPLGWNDVAGATQTELALLPIDPARDASGTLVITDRTGAQWIVPFSYLGDRVDITPERRVDFGEIGVGKSRDSQVVITNALNRDLTVKGVTLRSGVQSFSITSITPALPAVLPPGGSLRVIVRAAPASDKNLYRDTVRVLLTCHEVRLPLQIGPAPPCVVVPDLNFDTLTMGESRTLGLRICNDGHGTVNFSNPVGTYVLTWLEQNFSVPSADLLRLAATALGPDECVTVPVTYTAKQEGSFGATARVWANTRQCRDTSMWSVVVRRRPNLGVESAAAVVADVEAVPNPLTGMASIRLRLNAAAHARLAVYDAAGREIAVLLDGAADAGEHVLRWDAGAVASGLYYCRVTAGARTITIPLLVWR